MPIKHDFQSDVSDVGIPPGWVKPSNWNEDHVLDGTLAQLDAIAPLANNVPYFNDTATGAVFPLSPFMRSLMNSASISVLLTALNAASLNSPTFTGTPSAPTTITSDNSTKLATTAFVQAVIAQLVGGSPALLDTLNELATAIGDDPNFATTMTNALALKAPLNSPALTGTPSAPTPAASDNSSKIATTAYADAAVALLNTAITAALALKAPIASPTFTGDPKAPTPAAGDNDTSIATTAFVKTALNRTVPLAVGTDFNTVLADGTYNTNGDVTCTNTPAAGFNWYLQVQSYSQTTNWCFQLAVKLDFAGAETYVRSRVNGTWGGWNALGFPVGQIPATAGTTQPGAGKVGELISNSASANFATSGSAQSFTSILLTPGVWDIEASGQFNGSGSTTSSDWVLEIGTTPGSVITGALYSAHHRAPAGLDYSWQINIPRRRITVAANTTYYLNAQATFSGSTYGVNAEIVARRV